MMFVSCKSHLSTSVDIAYLMLVYMSGVPKMDITATREELNERKKIFSQPAGFEPALPEGI